MIKYFDEFMKDYTVQKKEEVETSKGDFKEVWEDEFIIRGALSTIKGRNKEIADSFSSETTHILYTAYFGVINNKNCKKFRIKDSEGLIYNIVNLDNVMDQDEYLKIFVNYTGGVQGDG